MGVHTNRDDGEQIAVEVVSIFYADGIVIVIFLGQDKSDTVIQSHEF